MENKKLIYEYLDGELDPMLEGKLFAEMSANQELRDEFSHQVKINKFALQDMNTMQVPSETTAAVFTNLGFTIPSSLGVKKASPLLLFLKSKRFAKASLSVAALFLVFISGWWLNNITSTSQTITNIQNTASVINTESTANTSKYSNANLPSNSIQSVNKSGKRINMASTGLSTANVNNRANAINRSDNAKNATNTTINSNEDIIASSSNIEKTNDIAQNAEKNNETVTQMLSYSSLNPIANDFSFSGNEYQLFDYINLNNQDSDFETTLYSRGLRIAKQLPVADDKSFFSGSSISLMYKLNDEHYIGGDFGEDEFYQEFFYQNGEQNVLYKQAPNYYWGAISYKYLPQFLKIGDFAQPYAKLSVGGCKAGVIGKAQLGFNLQINRSLNAFIGGEYNSLFFNIRRDFYTSHKFEILYGISINL